MEKLIHVLIGAGDTQENLRQQVAESTVPAVRSAGGQATSLLLSDCTEDLEARNPGRLIGDFRRLAALIEYWLPTVDHRAAVQETFSDLADETWGYLVTESTLSACPHDVDGGQRVPGVTQLGLLQKPTGVALDDFHREWAVHSEISFDLHPIRQSYDRNAVARPLTPGAPAYQGIVMERFPSIDDFVDDDTYFGDPAVVQRMIDHLPTFYDFDTALGGALSEFRWH